MKLREHITQHCHDSMARALLLDRHPLWKRGCSELKDIDFVRLGLLRCISTEDSRRNVLQITKDIYGQQLPLSTYFKSLKSARRTGMLQVIEKQSYQLHCATLQAQGVDYLKIFPELSEYTVEAVDGRFIDHVCHAKKGINGRAYNAGFIYTMNLRNGLLRPLYHVTNGAIRHHEITALRNYIEKQGEEKSPSQKHIYIFDKAAKDYAWWDGQKPYGEHI